MNILKEFSPTEIYDNTLKMRFDFSLYENHHLFNNLHTNTEYNLKLDFYEDNTKHPIEMELICKIRKHIRRGNQRVEYRLIVYCSDNTYIANWSKFIESYRKLSYSLNSIIRRNRNEFILEVYSISTYEHKLIEHELKNNGVRIKQSKDPITLLDDDQLTYLKKYKKHICLDLEVFDKFQSNSQLRKHKNLILYGVPGSGKTFISRNCSRLIINDSNYDNEERYEANCYFTTFHQSQSYEDFIEGIKPVTVKGNVTYEIKDGLFKKLCILALAKYCNIQEVPYLGGTIKLDELQLNIFSNQDKYINIYNKLKTILLQEIKSPPTKPSNEPIVLIIDEINRGNVSQIFGELITLIEEDKRYDAENAISVTLPYSGESFIVPPNLYIIGTMNTADRSVEALDTALRRRFVFKEMKPDYRLLEDVIVEGINISEMLRKMNEEISKIKSSRDYEIGHAYFWPLIEDPSLDKLKAIFANSILPLLKEYFYGDYSSIKKILKESENEVNPIVQNVSGEFYDVRIENIDKKDANYFVNIYTGIIEANE